MSGSIIPHTFSMRLASGDWEGHSIIVTSFSSFQVLQRRLQCFGLLSSCSYKKITKDPIFVFLCKHLLHRLQQSTLVNFYHFLCVQIFSKELQAAALREVSPNIDFYRMFKSALDKMCIVSTPNTLPRNPCPKGRFIRKNNLRPIATYICGSPSLAFLFAFFEEQRFWGRATVSSVFV